MAVTDAVGIPGSAAQATVGSFSGNFDWSLLGGELKFWYQFGELVNQPIYDFLDSTHIGDMRDSVESLVDQNNYGFGFWQGPGVMYYVE